MTPNTFEEASDAIKSNDDWRMADREALWKLMYEYGRAAERERCAAACDDRVWALDHGGNKYFRPAHAEQCAKAIRALK